MIRDDIISILKTVSYQTAMESIVRVDQFTGLYSAEYLYGQAKGTIDAAPRSIVAMFRITNIEENREATLGEVEDSHIGSHLD